MTVPSSFRVEPTADSAALAAGPPSEPMYLLAMFPGSCGLIEGLDLLVTRKICKEVRFIWNRERENCCDIWLSTL